MSKRSSATAERHADLVRTQLLAVAPDGLALLVLAAACGLSPWQTRRALAALRDICGEEEWPPVLWTRELGYHFCATEPELEAWELAWVSRELTAFRRMLTGTLGPHLKLFPNSAWAEYLTAQFRAIESNLEMAASYGAR
ncbi:RacP protein [Streptacidiphilus sp. PAMC 29251]